LFFKTRYYWVLLANIRNKFHNQADAIKNCMKIVISYIFGWVIMKEVRSV